MVSGKAQVNTDNCVDCGVCVDACPVSAISL
jgi:NAD-dependent dihydropyrimidine dehydrogenase PreA subunit